MTNEIRLAKLKQAENLIREVEFTYSIGDERRIWLYGAVVQIFSDGGLIDTVRTWIKDDMKTGKKGSL